RSHNLVTLVGIRYLNFSKNRKLMEPSIANIRKVFLSIDRIQRHLLRRLHFLRYPRTAGQHHERQPEEVTDGEAEFHPALPPTSPGLIVGLGGGGSSETPSTHRGSPSR